MKIRRPKQSKLPLTNAGQLSLFTVGCGSAFSKALYQNNVLIVKGNTHVMIDCGTRTPQALSALGRPVSDISTWLITHSHADHVGGLEEVMLMGRYVARSKPTVIITEEYEEMLWNMSLRGGGEFNEVHDGTGLGFSDFWNTIRPKPLEGYPRDTREVVMGDLNIKLVRTRHFPQQAPTWQESAYSIGVILDDRIFFTGDTQFDPELLQSYDERFHFEVIFHDVQFFTGGIHTGLDELATLPPEIKNRIILMHYGDTWKKQVKRVKQESFVGFARQGSFYTFD
jgi:ribonuclease BN (tRNA processing enzyme)